MKDKKNKSFNRQTEVQKSKSKQETQTTIPIHSYWFFAIMVVIASSMFVKHNRTEIQFHEATLGIYFHHLTIAISILFLCYGLIYWSQRKKTLTKWMTNVHSLLTLVIIGTFYMTCFQESTWNITPVLIWGAGILLVAQVVLALNIIVKKIK